MSKHHGYLLLLLLACLFQSKLILAFAFGRIKSQSYSLIVLKSSSSLSSYHGFDFTEKSKSIPWGFEGKPFVPLHAEIDLIQSGKLVQRGEYGNLSPERRLELAQQCYRVGMTLPQGLIVRKQVLATKAGRRHWTLEQRNLNSLFGKIPMLELSKEMDMPPVSIVRKVIQDRVDDIYPDWRHSDRKRLVKSIINEEAPELFQVLSDVEISELRIAKDNDIISFSFEKSELEANKWEQALYQLLDDYRINYVTEEQLRDAASNTTPDCLILDRLLIGGRQIRWIDMKNSYMSGLQESAIFSSKLARQIQKYRQEFGEEGAVIFRFGFSKKVQRKNDDTLFLDAGPLASKLEYCGEE